MKNFFLGLLIGLLIYGQAARALEVSFDQITLKDLYAACCLAGTISKYGDEWSPTQHALFSWNCANEMLFKRNKNDRKY